MSIDHVGGNSTATRLKTVNRCGDTNNGYALNCSADYLFNPSTPVGAGAWTNYLAHNPHANPGGIDAYLDNESPNIGLWKANEIAPVFHKEKAYLDRQRVVEGKSVLEREVLGGRAIITTKNRK